MHKIQLCVQHADEILLTVLQKCDDYGPRVVYPLTLFHLSSSVFALGEVDLQLVQQQLGVHHRQVGDENTFRTYLGIYLRDRRQEQITRSSFKKEK